MKPQIKKDIKKNAKRGAIIILCLIPFLVVFGFLFYLTGLPDWAQILLIASSGILLYICVELVYAKIMAKREAAAKANPQEKPFDPFAD